MRPSSARSGEAIVTFALHFKRLFFFAVEPEKQGRAGLGPFFWGPGFVAVRMVGQCRCARRFGLRFNKKGRSSVRGVDAMLHVRNVGCSLRPSHATMQGDLAWL